MTRTWRLRHLLREASQNVRTGGLRASLFLFAVTVSITGAAIFEAGSVQTILERDVDLIERGRYVMRITTASDSPQSIDASACERLVAQGGVLASGAVLSSSLVEITSSLGNRLRLILATPGAIDVLQLAQRATTQTIIGTEGATELSLTAGSTVVINSTELSRQTVAVDEVAQTSRRSAPAIAAIAISLLVAISLQTRRSEMGVYKATGTPRSALFCILYLEHLILLAAATIIAIPGFVASIVLFEQWASPAQHGLSALAISTASAAIGTAAILAGSVLGRNVIQALKDR